MDVKYKLASSRSQGWGIPLHMKKTKKKKKKKYETGAKDQV